MNKKIIVCLCLLAVTSCLALAQDSSNVRTVGSYSTSGTCYALTYAAIGGQDYVFIGFAWFLRIINVTNPALPVEEGHVDTKGRIYGIVVEDSFAYVANDTSGLRIIDIRNLSAPTEVGFYNPNVGLAYDVDVADSLVYLAYEGSLRIINASNPASPYERSFYYTPAYSCHDVVVSGNYAYVADGDSGLQIINISNPSNPRKAGHYKSSGYAYGVAIANNYAYVADGNNGLGIIDISDTANPFEKGRCNTPGSAHSVSVSGNFAYVADGDSGLRVISISDIANPIEVGYYCNQNFGNAYYSVSQSNGVIYATNWLGALRIYEGYGPAGVANDQVHAENLKSNYLKLRAYGNTIEYSLPYSGITSIKIYNLLGQEVRSLLNEDVAAGQHSIIWNDRDTGNSKVSSGVYIVQLQSGSQTASAKMIVVR